jgi:hypothetical protein
MKEADAGFGKREGQNIVLGMLSYFKKTVNILNIVLSEIERRRLQAGQS